MPFPTFDKQADIPKGFEGEYEEQDGKWVPKAPAPDDSLATELAAEKAKREAAEKLTRQTASELKKLQTQRKAEDAGLTAERLKEIEADALEQAEAKYKEQIDKLAKVEAQNRTLLLDADMKARALKAGIRPDKIDDFWALRAGEFDLTTDGKPMVKDKPTLDVGKHLEALKKRNPEWVVGTKADGGGAAGLTGAGAAGAFDDKMTAEQRLAKAHEAGLTE